MSTPSRSRSRPSGAAPATGRPRRTAQEAPPRARLADELAEGASLEEALLAVLRASSDADLAAGARSLVEGVGRLPDGGRAQALGLLYIGHRKKWWTLAQGALEQLADEDVARFLPVVGAEVMLRAGADPAARVRRLVSHAEVISTAHLVALAARALSLPDKELAGQIVGKVRSRGGDLDRAHRRQLALVAGWLSTEAPPAPPEGSVQLGVLDYNQPDQTRASRNVGDYVQTLAMTGHIARFTGCSLTGRDGLEEFVGDLQGRIPAELRLPEPRAAVHVLPVNRDASMLDHLDAPVWTIAFGWYMHPVFGIRYDFPFAPAIRPLFVSFHVHQAAILDEETLAYLRRYGPIGCRDWTTVYLLLGAGVDAFFSGCLTTTLDMTFPAREDVAPREPLIGAVDVPPRVTEGLPEPWEQVKHAGESYREATLTEGLRAAQGLLAGYQQRYSELVTSRLHAYLPATALGMPVRFRPATRSDIRFEGLLGLKPGGKRLTAIQDGLRDLLSGALRPVLEGAPEDEVYAHWRTLTAPAVAEARARFEGARDVTVAPRPGVDDGVAAARAGARRYGPEGQPAGEATHVHLTLAGGQVDQLPVTVESLLANASGEVRLWITSRDVDEAYEQWFSGAFPETVVTFVPCEGFAHRLPRKLARRGGLAQRDRLLVPDLLHDVDRVVCLEAGTVVLGDVSELARTDLGGHPFAARGTESPVVNTWRSAGMALRPPLATELRRSMAARHGCLARSLDAGVLVLDLARMRADGFTPTYVALGERYRLNVRDTLLAYAGGARAELDPRWNSWPSAELVDDARVLQYLGAAKPWRPGLAPAQEHWDTYAAAFERRVGAAGPGERARTVAPVPVPR